jgi:hypothetical protein
MDPGRVRQMEGDTKRLLKLSFNYLENTFENTL